VIIDVAIQDDTVVCVGGGSFIDQDADNENEGVVNQR